MSDLKLQFLETPTIGEAVHDEGGEVLTSTLLPDDRIERLGRRLIGLEGVLGEIQLHLWCRWDGELDRWEEKTGLQLHPATRAYLEEITPLFVLHGDPGVGKSVASQVAADAYCRATATPGRLYWLSTDVRGSGLVNSFSKHLRAAFQQISRTASSGPAFLVIDEADAVGMRRDEQHSHQEDRAGTACLLQCLDSLALHRVAVFMTTNLLASMDPAVLRRGQVLGFRRPDLSARRLLLRRWFPEGNSRLLEQAARASAKMTPADIDRALGRAYLHAVRTGEPITATRLVSALRQGERTGLLGGGHPDGT